MRLRTLAGLGFAACVLAAHPACAQAHNPFGVGISEGGGSADGITGWILNRQVLFERQLSAAVRASRTDGSALLTLMGLSLAYGVFHAAGPGHGKAVMTSYLFANERALRRGLVLTGLAALLQGGVAIALVGALALVFHATATGMRNAASLAESVSYAGVATLGAWLVWQKGRRFVAAIRSAMPARKVHLPVAASLPTGSLLGTDDCYCGRATLRYENLAASGTGPAVAARAHEPGCGHVHAPDPTRLGDGFSWSEAALTVLAAGARPCSGAILVLVFALAQGMFAAGIAAVLAMALGTALTTGALAALAVLAKGTALRLAAPGSRRGLVLIRGLETAAALVVLAAGLSLFFGLNATGGA